MAASFLLSACAAVPTSPMQEEGAASRLLIGMDECLAQQRAVESKLDRQSSRLEALELAMAATGAIESQSPTAAPPGQCKVKSRDNEKLVVGRFEKVWLPNLDVVLAARVDTGAETASIDARNIELFERNGKRWVRFEIVHPDSGEGVGVEREVARMVSIIQASQPEGERRPVIKMEIVIGSMKQTAEFTLSDRSHLDHQVLIGRNILQDVMVVDVSKKNNVPPAIGKNSAKVSRATP